MNAQDVDEIIACLPRGRTLFHYFKDCYALELLERYVGPGRHVRDVRASQYRSLLDRAGVKTALARAGSGLLTRDMLQAAWPQHFENYRLTLEQWPFGRVNDRFYHQTSRHGKNLVLLLNLATDRNCELFRMGPERYHRLHRYSGHPGKRYGELPMAWARIDLDFIENAALIEEVQTDWLREVRKAYRIATEGRDSSTSVPPPGVGLWGHYFPATKVRRYTERILRTHGAIWDEAMLWAAIWFIRDELGIRNIYYHTWQSGNVLKRLDDPCWGQPPRSLYTTLPRRFCFRVTYRPPDFLLKGRLNRAKRLLLERELLPMYVMTL